MAASSRRVVSFTPSISKPCKLLKWKVHIGSRMSIGTILLTYESTDNAAGSNTHQTSKLKSATEGTVQALIAKEGDIISPGCELLELQSSLHSVVMKDLCAECGADLRQLGGDGLAQVVAQRTFSMIHSVPELRVSQEQARKLGEADEERLLNSRKLVLLVDLDQTLIHTTNENIPPDMKGVFHFQLYGARSPWYHTKFRPGTHEFLQKISALYELHIFTFGARPYAHYIASLMDPKGRFFSHRILSRDECLSASSKSGNLKALFPCGDSMVCIIDDREDVWNFAPNVIQVKPYHFFLGTGDINSPPGLPPTETASSASTNMANKETTEVKKCEESVSESNSSDKTLTSESDPSSDDKTDLNAKTENTECDITDETDNKDVDSKQDAMELDNQDTELTEELQKNEPIINNGNELVSNEVCEETEPANETLNTNGVKKNDSEVIESTNGLESKENTEGQQNSDSPVTVSESDKSSKVQYTSRSHSISEGPIEEDDYLIYLEEILTTIHQAFFDMYDQLQIQGQKIPDLKSVIPYVRRKVLKGVNIVFSGVIPTTYDPEKSKLWSLAKAFGANVTVDLVGPDSPKATTHVIAARLGTAKVNKAKKMKGVHIINPDWLSSCTERWEHVDERLFPLTEEVAMRKPNRLHENRDRMLMEFPPNVTYTGHAMRVVEGPMEQCPVYDPVTGKRVRVIAGQKPVSVPVVHVKNTRRSKKGDGLTKPSACDSFSNTLSPLLSFSSNEIEDMGREVDDACSEESENDADQSSDSEGEKKEKNVEQSSSEDSLNAGEIPRGWKKRNRSKETDQNSETEDDVEDNKLESSGESGSKRQRSGLGKEHKETFHGILDSEDVTCDSKFPRNEIPLDSDRSEMSNSNDSNESIGSVDEEMAAAVEREFLGS